jgi:hypothetical protein
MTDKTVSQVAAGGQHQNPSIRAGDVVAVSADPRASALKFLDFIFADVVGGYVEFRFFGAGPKPKVVDQSAYRLLPLEHEWVEQEILPRSGRQMITVGPAPRFQAPQRGKAGKDQDDCQVSCVWADLDFKQYQNGAMDVVRRIADFPLRPSVVINSGYGRHVYFVFRTPLQANSLPLWDKIIRGLRDALDSDATINLSRVMRLPGTLNIKYPDAAVMCELNEEDSSWLRYHPDEVVDAIEQVNTLKRSGPAVALQSLDAKLPADGTVSLGDLHRRNVPYDLKVAIVSGKRTIRTGVNAGRDDDDSARDFWIACSLLERGFGIEEIKAVFRQHPHGCGSKWAQKQHGEKYLDLTVNKAVARYKEKVERIAAWREHGVEDEEGVRIFEEQMPFGYSLGADGSIWLEPPLSDADKKPTKPPTKVCNSFLRITEIQENIDTGQILVVIDYKYLGRLRRTTITRSQMADSRQLVAALAGEGAPISSNNARLVLSYLTAYEHAFGDTLPRKKVTSRFGRGRESGPFFLPGLSSDIEFVPSGPGDMSLYRAYSSRRGVLKDWVEVMRAVADHGLMIPQVCVLAAFVPPLQRRLQIPNFILDLHGNTSTGKSTSIKLAASVFGKPDDPDSLVQQWMNTKVAVEQIAGMCSELPVFLDDAQHCADDLKKSVVYLIANGKGKGRGAKGGGLRETLTWHTVALSTSEEPLHESSPHEGARGRILSIGGATPPFRPGEGTFVQSLERAIAANHGHAGEAFIRHINNWSDFDWYDWQRRYTSIRTELLRGSSSDIVGRVSGYIASIQLAGEIACPLLGLSFKADVLTAWLMVHIEEQQSDQNLVLLALRALADHYVSNLNNFSGDGRYEESEKRSGLHGASKRHAYVGFLRSTVETVFRQRKWNMTAVLNKMAEAQVLFGAEEDRHTKKVSVEGVKHRMVCVKWTALLPEDTYSLDDLKGNNGQAQVKEN